MHLHPETSIHQGNQSLQSPGREEKEVIKEQTHRIKMVALNGGVWQEVVTEALCEGSLGQGDPNQACGRKQSTSNTALPFSFSTPTSWDLGAAASLISDGKLWELQETCFSTRPHPHTSPPTMERWTPLELISTAEQGVTKGHHPPGCRRGSALG